MLVLILKKKNGILWVENGWKHHLLVEIRPEPNKDNADVVNRLVHIYIMKFICERPLIILFADWDSSSTGSYALPLSAPCPLFSIFQNDAVDGAGLGVNLHFQTVIKD